MSTLRGDNTFIQYEDYQPDIHASFFREKKENLLFFKKYNTEQDNNEKFQTILAKAQEGLSKVDNQYVTTEALGNAVTKSMDSLSGLSKDIEQIAQSMNKYFTEADKLSKYVNKEYEDGFGRFELLMQEVINKGSIITSKDDVEILLKRLKPENLKNEFAEVGNPLGKIGELVGMIQLYKIGEELVKTCFQDKKYKNIEIEVINVGEKSGTQKDNTKTTLTTDNLLVIRQGNEVLFSLNLSNKLNTAYKSESKTTKRSIKLRTTTVKSFLKEHFDWSEHVYNAISYHYDTSKKERVDFLDHDSGIARQTLGIQILYDHIFGTRSSFEVGGKTFSDEVALIAYGTKVVASSNVLKNALFTKAMNSKKKHIMAQIPDRRDWIKGEFKTGKSYIINELDAQRKINSFSLIYSQTLQIDSPLKL